MVELGRNNHKKDKKVAPRDELRGHFTCVRLVGIEPTASGSVITALYPMSYNRTQFEN
jgi:hypothetical protein